MATPKAVSPDLPPASPNGGSPGMKHPGLDTPPSQQIPSWSIGTTEPGGSTRAQSKLNARDYTGSGKSFPRLSRPVELLRHSYDVVVIGSGYGGGVAASRMARAGQSVCILERGKERWPGEYPDNLATAAPEIAVSGLFAPGNSTGEYVKVGSPTALYQLVLGQGQNAFVASGLGGTSLLNANVFLEADEKTMGLGEWPPQLQKAGALDDYYRLAKDMLQPETYPKEFPPLPKLELLEKQYEVLKREIAPEWRSATGEPNEPTFYRVPQTTRFEDGPNKVGVQMQASTLTGMDSTGINDGSKSSTLVTYLADSWNWGAEIFCECEVRYVKKHPDPEKGGYLVCFAWHGSKRAHFKDNIYDDLMWIHAKQFVVFGAGALGTTEILLRSKSLGLRMSNTVGEEMSGNGDILAFGYNTNEACFSPVTTKFLTRSQTVNGMGSPSPAPERPVGPTITGVIDCRKQENPLDGFVIEEGAIPAPLVPMLQAMLEIMPGKVFPSDFDIPHRLRHLISRTASRLWAYAPRGSLERTQTYLIMSHDSNQAVMTLEKGKPTLRWGGVGRSEHTRYLINILSKLTNAFGGTYINSPFYASVGEQQITVHIIGGARMASDGNGLTGSTDDTGRLFKGEGNEVYDGLIVVDGAIIPTALGVNPFATITAVAERSVYEAASRSGLKIDYETTNDVLDLEKRPRIEWPMDPPLQDAHNTVQEALNCSSQGIAFTEVMSGFMNVQDDIRDYDTAFDSATAAGANARFFLSVRAWNTDNLVGRQEHPSMLTGTFTCAGLKGSPFMVLRGDFHLFTKDSRTPDTTNLKYEFDMMSTDGELIHFSGYKIVNPSIMLRPLATWKATSTLYCTLSKQDKVIGRGQLNIQPRDFVSELRTFTPTGTSLLAKLFSTSKFLSFFTKQLVSKFLGPLGSEQFPMTTFQGYETNKKAPHKTFKISSLDGVVSILHQWKPATHALEDRKGTILFIPGASVDHQIFALPTINTNAVEYFQKQEFEVFCVTHRVGKTPNAMRDFTTFDARLDIQAAFREIHELHGKSQAPIYVIAHCAGSVALASGLLDGVIPSRWLSGLTASQVFFNPKFGTVNKVKASLPVPMTKVYRALAGEWFSCVSGEHDSIVQRLLNQVVKLYPVGSMEELCTSVVCHRSELVFGRLWSHKRLNAATHSNLSKFLGGTSMMSLEHLMYMGTHGYVTDNHNTSLVTKPNLDRLKGLSILFLSGTENVVYSPETTDTSFTTLTSHFQQAGYERKLLQGYGHLDCWMSESAVDDVYPAVFHHIEKCLKSESKTKASGLNGGE